MAAERKCPRKKRPAIATFSFSWKIDWNEFEAISTRKIVKYFIAANENVAFHWRVSIGSKPQVAPGKLCVKIKLEDGPIDSLDDVSYVVTILKADKSYSNVLEIQKYNALIGSSEGSDDFDDMDPNVFRNKHGLHTGEPLTYRIHMKIPASEFSRSIKYTLFDFKIDDHVPGKYAFYADLFPLLEDPTSKFSDVQLISGDSKTFYCHKIVLCQSTVLEAMFRNAGTEEEKRNIFRFPKLCYQALTAVLEFFYTGETSLGLLSTTILIDAADFAESYNMKKLKILCAECLWDRVVKNVDECFDVLRFVDWHDDLKYLKDRTMDVLFENYDKQNKLESIENFSQNITNTKRKSDRDEDGQGMRLREQFMVYMCRRVEPSFG